MRLISLIETSNDDTFEHVFRYSSLGSVIVFTVFFALFLTCNAYYVWYLVYDSVNFLGHMAYIWFAFWFGFVAWLAWSRLMATRLPSNWLARAGTQRVLIKFRSFQNYAYPDIDPVVIELFWREIDWIRKIKEKTHKSSSSADSDITEFNIYLDLKLNISEAELKQIESGLAKERNNKPLRSEVGQLRHELFKARKNKAAKHEIDHLKQRIREAKAMKHQSSSRSSVKHHDYPVSLQDNGILRIRWNSVKPNVKRALSLFSHHVKLEETLDYEIDTREKLKGQALEDMILDRLVKGDKMNAIDIVKKHYGYSTTEAMQFIDELTEK